MWGKKEAHGDADDKAQGLGDCWEHDSIEVASRAVSVRVPGPRTAETGQSALLELKEGEEMGRKWGQVLLFASKSPFPYQGTLTMRCCKT